MSSLSPAPVGRDLAYLSFLPAALIGIGIWILDNAPMGLTDKQVYAMLFGLPLAMVALGSVPLSLVMAGIHRRERPLVVLAALTAVTAVAVATETVDAETWTPVYGLSVLAVEALWFFRRRRTTAIA